MNSVTRHLVSILLVGSCASGTQNTARTDAVQGHVYAVPVDDALAATTSLLTQKGWRVERQGDQLGTNWRVDATGSAIGYRVDGERIDEVHCSIHIESLAATSFAGPTASRGPSSAASGPGLPWDGVDAPTTLGEPPSGMVTLPRGRDEALEWELLQRLDPHAAASIQRAQAHPAAGAAPATLDAGPAGPPSGGLLPPISCEPEPTGVEALFAGRPLVLLAEVRGTQQIPDFLGRLACLAARKGVPTLVALELLRSDQQWVDTYLASQGHKADRTAFLQVARSFNPASGGHATEEILEVLDGIRVLRDAGLSLRVVAFDDASASGQAKARAGTLESARRAETDTLLLVLLDRSTARTVLGPSETPEQAPVGFYLAHWGLHPLALDVRSPGGQAWTCSGRAQGKCGPLPVSALQAQPPPGGLANSIRLYTAADGQGFAGEYVVGPLTASAPATP